MLGTFFSSDTVRSFRLTSMLRTRRRVEYLRGNCIVLQILIYTVFCYAINDTEIRNYLVKLEHYSQLFCFKPRKTQSITLKGMTLKLFSENRYGTIPHCNIVLPLLAVLASISTSMEPANI